VTQLKRVEVRGKSEGGDFSGTLEFAGGLQVISAKNAYGKSLAVKGVTWCLGFDPMFGNAENDPIRLPEAVREDLELAGHKSRVLSSECSITLEDERGRMLEITRPITGGDTRVVEVRERDPKGAARVRALGSASDQSRLVAAYSLALAATAQQVGGKHPGFIIMDEPLQQNPDKPHRDLFATFLTKELAQKSKFQTLVFTWLGDAEISKLRKQGTVVLTPAGEHFLQPTKPVAAVTTLGVPPADVGPRAG
jgi:hypothetical protein